MFGDFIKLYLVISMVATLSGKSGKIRKNKSPEKSGENGGFRKKVRKVRKNQEKQKKKTKVRKSQEKMGVFEKKS